MPLSLTTTTMSGQDTSMNVNQSSINNNNDSNNEFSFIRISKFILEY